MNYSSRKFALATFSIIVSAIALFADKIDGGTWVAALTLVLGIYNSANVIEKKNK